MSTYLLAIGINHYTDRAFRALSCCENDASEIHALFKRNLELGDRASKLVGAVSIADVKNELRRIGQEIRNGDTFILFFAGHGYQHPKREDQFLLFPEAEARLVNKGYLDGMISLSALCELTEHWAGVARVFILDACRSWLPGRDASGTRFDNEAALAYIASRDPAFGPDNAKPTDSLNAPGGALPPVILNATRNGQEAKELEDRQRGVLALALEQALESQRKSGEVIWLGEQMLTDVNQRMNALLQHGRLGVDQTPFLTPPSARVLLFKPQRITEAPTNDDDETEWAIAVAKQSIEAYETYARRKPPGKYRDDALRRIGELASNEASQEQQEKTKRDEARRQQALGKNDLAAWQHALKGAETEALRLEAHGQITGFEQEAARIVAEEERSAMAARRNREALEQQAKKNQQAQEEADRRAKEKAAAEEAGRILTKERAERSRLKFKQNANNWENPVNKSADSQGVTARNHVLFSPVIMLFLIMFLIGIFHINTNGVNIVDDSMLFTYFLYTIMFPFVLAGFGVIVLEVFDRFYKKSGPLLDNLVAASISIPAYIFVLWQA